MNKNSIFNPIAYVSTGVENRNSTDNYLEITGDKKRDIKNINRFIGHRCIMVGESHEDEHCRWFIEACIDLFKPDFMLTEHTLWLNVMPGEFEKRLKELGIDGLPFNKYTGYWLNVLRLYDIPLIGMDYLPPDGKLSTFIKEVAEGNLASSFIKREARMLEVLEQYYPKGKVLLQVGDTHLRESAEFYYGGGSPLMKFAKAHADEVGVFRLSKIYQEMP